jgi:hypothetical protein
MNKSVGYYIVGNQEFSSKIQAVLYASQHNLNLSWRFNNEVFEKYNWEVEPEETLDQLYDARARELREKYDYLMVSYSGGSDSNNLMESFIRQGLHVDEILVITTDKINKNHTEYDISNKKPENISAEHVLHTIPKLNELKKQCPNTKITIRDMTDNVLEMLSNSVDGDWILTKRETLNPIGMARFDFKYINEVRKNFDSNKKIAIVLGLEKPRTMIKSDTGEFLIYFNDRATNMIPVIDVLDEYASSVEVEYFYWSPSCVKMLCKQAHVIKKWLEVNPQYQRIWADITVQSLFGIQEPLLKNIIYTTWNNNWYQVDKPLNDFACEISDGFFKEFKNTNIYGKWEDGINFLRQNATKFLRQDLDSLKSHCHFYKIGIMCSKNYLY